MYRLLWRLLPGPVPVRIILVVALAAGVLISLEEWVFPMIAASAWFNNVTVGP